MRILIRNKIDIVGNYFVTWRLPVLIFSLAIIFIGQSAAAIDTVIIFSAMDARPSHADSIRQEVADLVRANRAKGRTVIIATPKPEMMARADATVLSVDGRPGTLDPLLKRARETLGPGNRLFIEFIGTGANLNQSAGRPNPTGVFFIKDGDETLSNTELHHWEIAEAIKKNIPSANPIVVLGAYGGAKSLVRFYSSYENGSCGVAGPTKNIQGFDQTAEKYLQQLHSPVPSADLDHDGVISLLEAHISATIASELQPESSSFSSLAFVNQVFDHQALDNSDGFTADLVELVDKIGGIPRSPLIPDDCNCRAEAGMLTANGKKILAYRNSLISQYNMIYSQNAEEIGVLIKEISATKEKWASMTFMQKIESITEQRDLTDQQTAKVKKFSAYFGATAMASQLNRILSVYKLPYGAALRAKENLDSVLACETR